jgi:glutathione synthase/RimK-type ligase-like ATP-grasp enzyme
MQAMGFVVLKPVVGLGRLGASRRPRRCGESFEHRANELHVIHAHYLQRYVEKGPRRAVVERVVAAIRRWSASWRTNTTGEAAGVAVSGDPASVCLRRARGGGGMLATICSRPDGYLVNEINDTMEFRNSTRHRGDIPGH